VKLNKCKCGSDARVRYKKPYTWVECKNKCGVRTGVYCDIIGEEDAFSRKRAEQAWNEMVKKSNI